MKLRYIIVLVFLVLLLIFLEHRLYFQSLPPEDDKRLEYMISVFALFVALVSSVIALSNSDRKPKKIDVEVSPKVLADEKPAEYNLAELPSYIQTFYGASTGVFFSHRIFFKFKNKSGFSLKKPTLSFRLPRSLQHPYWMDYGGGALLKDDKLIKGEWILSFNSNMYNSQQDIRILEFQDSLILSNTNLPYWNNSEPLEFWIRMCLDKNSDKIFQIIVSINSDNAEGISKNIRLNPKELFTD